MSDWRPIETAPKDGTRILVWALHYGRFRDIAFARWEDLRPEPSDYWSDGRLGPGWYVSGASFVEPTHWRPVPDPPQEEISAPGGG